ncbi:sterol desaturase family protein [Sphingopyxis sp.]|jgi:sterol desaturase/sphingolipid hydroxylase (fatty acid hydroxylase superfamily)|uniref:sterol desaturase family protein n=1 Tax=Sphingopyxis sp. TaxID=1908224 RepID=UPI003F6FA6FB
MLVVGGLKGFAKAALFVGLAASWYVLKGMIIFMAFFLAEYVLVGSPKNWKALAFPLILRVSFILLIIPILNRVIPTTGFQPLLVLEHAHFPEFLLPVAGLVLAMGTLVVADFVGYLAHRLEHAIPFLWRFHSVHHAIEDLNAINSNTHPVDSIVERLGLIAFGTLIGFKADTIVILVAFQILHDRLNHTSAPINLGKLNIILTDNRTHHLHHSILPEHHDKNFAAIFTFWDRVFGTYVHPHPTKLPITGLSDKLPPSTLSQFFFGTLKDRNVEDSAGKSSKVSNVDIVAE